MSLQFPNHVALIYNSFRIPENPTNRYVNYTLPKNIKAFKKRLIHYNRFLKKPQITHTKLDDITFDLSPYGSFLKVAGDIFNVRVIWKKILNGTDVYKSCILVGNEFDVKLCKAFIIMLCTIAHRVEERERILYKRITEQYRKKKRRGTVIPTELEDYRVYARKFRVKLVYSINSSLIELLEVANICPYKNLINSYILKHVKVSMDNKRGNPNWLQEYRENLSTAVSKDLLFKENKILN